MKKNMKNTAANNSKPKSDNAKTVTVPATETPTPQAEPAPGITALLPQTATAAACPTVVEQTPTNEPEQTAAQNEPEIPRISEKDDMDGKQTVMVELKNLRPSPYNPRKSYNKQGIRELADTINEVGLLQPIHVREVEGHYEIIFGERRYHAAQLLKWKQIATYVRVVSDEVARDMALTENLQREDMPPMDEAAAYLEQVNEGKDIYTLAAKYGKSDSYIYNRLKLNELIPENADLLRRELISMGLAIEIAKCERHIQEDMYKRFFKDEKGHENDPTTGWRGKSVSDFKELIKNTYTTDLENYNFDKTACLSCAHNTNTYDLFANCDGQCTTCGHCTNTDCLKAKNESFILAKATALLKETPRAVVGKSPYGYENPVANKLIESGHESKSFGYYPNSFPTAPSAPDKAKFKEVEQFELAQQQYEKSLKRYEKESAEIQQKIENGDARVFVRAERNDAELVYTLVNKRDVEQDLVKRLTEQKTANLLKAFEKTIEDTRSLVYESIEKPAPFTAFEENALYFILLETVRHTHRELFGDAYKYSSFNSEQKIEIIKKLTPEQKDIIRRECISAYLYSNSTDKITGQMLMEYANMHFTKDYGIIKARYDEIYENKNNRLDERIAEYTAKEKVKQEQAQKKAAKEKELQTADEKKETKAAKGKKAKAVEALQTAA